MSKGGFSFIAAALIFPGLPGPLCTGADVKYQRTEPDVVLFQGEYPGWPWVTLGKDGKIYCVFREGTRHEYSSTGKALIVKSNDGGKTWTKPAVVVDEPNVDDRNVAVVELPGPRLLVTYNSYTARMESLAMSVISRDGGETWSVPRPIGEPNTRTRSAAILLENGEWLLPFYVAPGNGALAAVSKDQGSSWKTVRVPDTEGFVGDEWDALEISPRRIIGVMRNSHAKSDGTFWLTESKDGGATWSIPTPTNLQSRRAASPAQIAWQGKMPTVIYSDRRMVSVSAARARDSSFLVWDVENPVGCYLYNADASPISDGSYPSSVQVSPNRRFIVDYEIRSATHQIAGYFVEFPPGWEATHEAIKRE